MSEQKDIRMIAAVINPGRVILKIGFWFSLGLIALGCLASVFVIR